MKKKNKDILIAAIIVFSTSCSIIVIGGGIAGAAVGALAGWGLSFITLPTLVRGGIIGSALSILCVAWSIGKLLYNLYNEKGIEKDKNDLIWPSMKVLIDAAIGVGLAAAGLTSGAVIGAIVQIVIATYFTITLTVKTITELCYSQEQGNNDLSRSSPGMLNEESNTPSSRLLGDANLQEISDGKKSLDPAH